MNRPRAEILTIGDELLKGSVLNTNARFLARRLTDLGFDLKFQVSCRDSQAAIKQRLAESLARSDLLILTGGLGPTPDDVTRQAVADFFGVPLVFSAAQWSQITRHYKRHGHKIPGMVRREATFPQNAVPLVNRFGIALGFYIFHQNRLIVVLPGVPRELEKMFEELVSKLLRKHFRDLKKRPALTVKLAGLSEPEVMERLGKDFFDDVFDFGIYPEAGEVSLRIYAEKVSLIARLKAKIEKRLRDSIYAFQEISLSGAIGKILARKKRTLAVAESCTGGLLASEITKTPGASRYFKGGVTAYHNAVKKRWLDISKETLQRDGAVSKKVALRLAQNVRQKMKAAYGIGVTGIAGPRGAGPKKPVGLVFIAVSSADGSQVGRFLFWGDRFQVQTKAVKKALEMLWRDLKKGPP